MSDTIIRDVCLYTLRSSTQMSHTVSKTHRLALAETLKCLSDNDGSGNDDEKSYASVNNGLVVAECDEECPPPHDMKSVDKIALSIVLENIEASSSSLATNEFVDAVKEVLPTLLRDHYSLVPVEVIQAMMEKVDCQDWEGWLALASMAPSAVIETKGSIFPEQQEVEGEQEPLVHPHDLLDLTSREGYGSTSQTTHDPAIRLSNDEQLTVFREMMIGMVSSSRLLASQSYQLRRVLNRNINAASSQEAITKAVLDFLNMTSNVDDLERQTGVQNAFARQRYDLLLRSEYMDCDDECDGDKTTLESPDEAYCSAEEHHVGTEDQDFEIGTESCTICFNSTMKEEGGIILTCQHAFCTGCIQEWAKHSPTCPTCRQPIDSPHVPIPATVAPVPRRQIDSMLPILQREQLRENRRKLFRFVVLLLFIFMILDSPSQTCTIYLLSILVFANFISSLNIIHHTVKRVSFFQCRSNFWQPISFKIWMEELTIAIQFV